MAIRPSNSDALQVHPHVPAWRSRVCVDLVALVHDCLVQLKSDSDAFTVLEHGSVSYGLDCETSDIDVLVLARIVDNQQPDTQRVEGSVL